jgi:predicted flap endonuclease-1-like 5' DNA nuclease
VIEGLLNGVGIRSWSDLAAADIDTLTSTLADAGSRFARYNPASWPEQARALMAGDWAQFESLG